MATEYRQRPGGVGDHFDDEDLVMSSAQQRRNWRGILIALMVIIAVLAMIVTSVVLLTPPQPEELSDSYSDFGYGDRDGSDYYYNQRAHDELWWRRRGMRPIGLWDSLADSASVKTFNGTWISGDEAFYVTGSGDLAVMQVMADATVQTTRHLMFKLTLQKLKGPLISFELSPDRNHVLIGHDAKKLLRYSKTARYTVYTVSTGQTTPVILEETTSKTATDQPYLLHAQWHRISTEADRYRTGGPMALIAVHRHDVFYVPWTPVSSSTETPQSQDASDSNSTDGQSAKTWPHGPVRRITTSGSGTAASAISNGVADYLYELEILKRSPAVWPSSGRYLMYATFDDRRVGDYKYSVYAKDGLQDSGHDGGSSSPQQKQQELQRKTKRRRRRMRRDAKSAEAGETSEYYLYPKIRTMKYPKANTPNPIVTLSVIVNLDQLGDTKVQPKIRILTPPPIFQYTDDYYFTAAQWVNDGRVSARLDDDDDDVNSSASAAEICVVWLNRAQNTSVTTLCKSPIWMCQETQVINAVGSARYGDSGVGGRTGGHRYRRNGDQYPRGRQRRAGAEVDSAAGTAAAGGWVDAAVGGAGGGVPSTGGGFYVAPLPSVWWSTERGAYDGAENFAADDGYGGSDRHAAAALVRRGWESGDKELTPRAPVFAADGQGYVSVAPVRIAVDDASLRGADGNVRLRRPSTAQKHHDGNSQTEGPVGKYFAQLVAVNITKKLLEPLTFGEPDDAAGNGGDGEPLENHMKTWTVVRILAWDRRSDMIYFLAVPSGRGAPHHRHLYAVKFTSPSYSPVSESSIRSGFHRQQQHHKKIVRDDDRGRPVCLSCDVRTNVDTRIRKRRDFVGGKQNRMDEARDDRLRQQQRERWENQKGAEKANNEADAASVDEEVESRHQRRQNRRRQQQEIQNHGTVRHCTYYDAQFSQDGSHYALVCLGPSVPYVTLHRIATDPSNGAVENNYDDGSGGGGGGGDEVDSTQDVVAPQKPPEHNSITYSFEFIAQIENNTRLQDKYTNRVLLPGTRTFQLRLSGGRKLTTSGGLHFDDPLAAADYYGNGGGQQPHFSSRRRPDLDPLTVAQVRLYLPLSVYDPEADQRPEFMSNRVSGYDGSSDRADGSVPKAAATDADDGLPLTRDRHRRRRRSPSPRDNNNDGANGSKRPRRPPYKQQRKRRYKKLYPMLVVVNSDPGSQAITDRFSDRLGYTTALLCSGSFGKALTGRVRGGGSGSGSRFNRNKRNRRGGMASRSRRSATTGYYSSSRLADNENYEPKDYDDEQGDVGHAIDNEYVVAVIDPGRGAWARGYESLLALNYNAENHRNNSDKEESELGRQLGTADIRDQMEAVEYILSSATVVDADSFKDNGQGYYSNENRARSGHGVRDGSRWFSSPSQSNRRYYSDDDDDYYNNYNDYMDRNGNVDNYDDYYYYYYSNGGDSSDYGGGRKSQNADVDRDGKRGRKVRRSTSNTKVNAEALRLPYVDATRVALLGGGPRSPSTPSSVYGGYAAARMAFWQSAYGGAPIERSNGEDGKNENRKEPVVIRSSFKCAITMAPVYSWRLYASAFSERYYGYYSRNHEDNWTSYDRSNLIPSTESSNDTSFSQLSNGKGINLLVVHGTADTVVHPQHSMMLVREVMQQQQQPYVPNGFGGNLRTRDNGSTTFRRRVSSRHPFRAGPIRLSQLVLPDVDLSNLKLNTGVDHSPSIEYQHQLLHSIYGHVTQYLETECFNGAFDGTRGQGVRLRGRSLRKRRRRRWRNSNRNQENLDDQQQQNRREEHRQLHQKSRRSVSATYDDGVSGDDLSSHRRYRRRVVDSGSNTISSKVKTSTVKIKVKDNGSNIVCKTNSVHWNNHTVSDLTNINRRKGKNSSDSEKQVNDKIHPNDTVGKTIKSNDKILEI